MDVFCVFIFLVLLSSGLGLLAVHLWGKAKALEEAAYDLITMDRLESAQYARQNPRLFPNWYDYAGHTKKDVTISEVPR